MTRRWCPFCGLDAHPCGRCDDVRSPEGLYCPFDGHFGRHRRCARAARRRCPWCGGNLLREDRIDARGRREPVLACLLCGRERPAESAELAAERARADGLRDVLAAVRPALLRAGARGGPGARAAGAVAEQLALDVARALGEPAPGAGVRAEGGMEVKTRRENGKE